MVFCVSVSVREVVTSSPEGFVVVGGVDVVPGTGTFVVTGAFVAKDKPSTTITSSDSPSDSMGSHWN